MQKLFKRMSKHQTSSFLEGATSAFNPFSHPLSADLSEQGQISADIEQARIDVQAAEEILEKDLNKTRRFG